MGDNCKTKYRKLKGTYLYENFFWSIFVRVDGYEITSNKKGKYVNRRNVIQGSGTLTQTVDHSGTVCKSLTYLISTLGKEQLAINSAGRSPVSGISHRKYPPGSLPSTTVTDGK